MARIKVKEASRVNFPPKICCADDNFGIYKFNLVEVWYWILDNPPVIGPINWVSELLILPSD